ncbi:Bacterial extracellular solute-binding protein [compost metagenome]
MQEWIAAGAFGPGDLNLDYGMARSLFGEGKAAMFMMGDWEMGMAADPEFPEEVRGHMGAFPLPAVRGGLGSTEDLPSWFGGGYAVSNRSVHKQEAVRFLKWMFRPEGWGKEVWQNGVAFPAQNYDRFLTGHESAVQRDLMEIFGRARTHSGTLTQDKFRTEPQRQYYDALQLLEAGELTPEAFVNVIENAAEKNMAAN